MPQKKAAHPGGFFIDLRRSPVNRASGRGGRDGRDGRGHSADGPCSSGAAIVDGRRVHHAWNADRHPDIHTGQGGAGEHESGSADAGSNEPLFHFSPALLRVQPS
ncbi:hypothetical protein D555_0194 [Bordetella holmesii 35009]|nr:hypothetical protein D555_0194 [Bordetella holmesii 35009]